MISYSSNDSKKPKEKRKGPDFVIYWIKISAVIVWIGLSTFFMIINYAQPEKRTFFDYLLDVQRRQTWDTTLMTTAFGLAVFLFLFSILSLLLNTKRLKRQNDSTSFSLILSLIVSGVSIVLFLLFHITR